MNTGIGSVTSDHSVDEIVEQLKAVLAEKGVKLFALVDHSGEAKVAGLEMLPTKLLIFGNPRAGTPVMVSTPSAALDLPLKILVAEDASGKTVVSWNDPTWMQERHGFDKGLIGNLAAAEMMAKKVAE